MGCDPDARNDQGQTPRGLAQATSTGEIFRKVDWHGSQKRGGTPLLPQSPPQLERAEIRPPPETFSNKSLGVGEYDWRRQVAEEDAEGYADKLFEGYTGQSVPSSNDTDQLRHPEERKAME